jgi:hypothetical protein
MIAAARAGPQLLPAALPLDTAGSLLESQRRSRRLGIVSPAGSQEGAFMRKIAIVTLTAFAAISWDSVSHNVFADGVSVRPHARKCGRYDHCGFPVTCPPWTCYSLYGLYGPYGGASYWGRYTYEGWRRP